MARKKAAPKKAMKKTSKGKVTKVSKTKVSIAKVAKKVKAAAKKAAPAKAPKKVAAKKPAKVAQKSSPKTSAPKKAAPLRLVSSLGAGISPLRDRVLVEPAGESDRTPGGLYIPTTALERPLRGIVVAVGSGSIDKKGRRKQLDVKVGDQVLYASSVGNEVKFGGQEFLILREEEILGIVGH